MMRSRTLCFVLLPLLGVLSVSPLQAQLISLKTVPLATGQQFQLFPADRVGIGALSIALADTLRDPVASPATGARLDDVRFFGAPVVYNYAGREGGGLTLPLGAFGSAGRWFGGLAGAVQELQPTQTNPDGWLRGIYLTGPDNVLPPQARSDSRLNSYIFAFGGLRVGDRDAVAMSMARAWLQAVQGVEQMYDGAAAVVQNGDMLDLRLGFMHAYDDGGSLDVVLLREGLDVTHDVAYLNVLALDPVTGSPLPVFTWEHNRDRVRTLGAFARYARPVNDDWRAGFAFTVNRKTHPKIPNYQIMNIPRDPGTSTALSAGVGAAYQSGDVVFGADLVLEPAWTVTWALADAPIVMDSTVLVAEGERSVENHFRFMNGIIRLGAARDAGHFTLGGGLEMRSIGYHMTQYRFEQPWMLRRQDERWIEWRPTWGAALRLPGVVLRYSGGVTFGSGAHTNRTWVWLADASSPALDNVDFIPAPDAPLDFDYLTVWTHQLSVSLRRPWPGRTASRR